MRAETSYQVEIIQPDDRKKYQKGLQAFVKEARILAEARNIDGIVPVHNFFQENGTAYIVMEYIDGIVLGE